MRKVTGWGAIALGAAAVLLAVSPAWADTFRADIEDFAFTPDPILIGVGDRVRWTNRGDETHTVTADDGSFDGEDVDPDKTYSKTFRQPGRFPYRCTRHPDMTGVVEVGGDGRTPAPPPGASETTSSTSGSDAATTTTAERTPPTTAVPGPAITAPTVGPTAGGTVARPVLRPSTTSTSTPPVTDERVTITTGEAPVFTPTPEELFAGPPEATGDGPSGDGRVGGTSGDAEDLGWAPLAVVGAGTAGLAGFLLARRRKARVRGRRLRHEAD
jgi:plastocyanin